MVKRESNQLKIIIYGYDVATTDETTRTFVKQLSQVKTDFSGPIALPTKSKVITVPISPHKHKDSQEQFIREVHRRVIFIIDPSPQIIKTLDRLEKAGNTGIKLVVVSD